MVTIFYNHWGVRNTSDRKLQFVYLQSNCNREFVGFIGTIKPKLQARLSTDSQSSNVSVTSMLSTQTDRTHKTSPVLHKWNSEKGKHGTMLLLEIFAKYDLKSYLSFFVIEGRGLIITVLLSDPYFFILYPFLFSVLYKWYSFSNPYNCCLWSTVCTMRKNFSYQVLDDLVVEQYLPLHHQIGRFVKLLVCFK